ncbi:MAG: tetratricopeptide repeat protein [Phycisphaerae bacterium]|nr:tetratricopeptide repeat protein [Phycisphaerae bacterium]
MKRRKNSMRPDLGRRPRDKIRAVRSDGQTSPPSIWNAALAVFALGLLVRVLALFTLADSPLLSVLMGDARAYDQWAREIAAGDWLGREVFYQAPLYPYSVGLLYSVFGIWPLIVRCVQVVLGAAACAMLVPVGRHFFDFRTGVLSGLLLALYPPAIFFDLIIQKAAIALVLLVLMLFSLTRIHTAKSLFWSAATGALLGLLVLTRENAVVLLPIVVLAVLLRPRTSVSTPAVPIDAHNDEPPSGRFLAAESSRVSWRGALTSTAVIVIAFLVILTPVAWRNYSIGGVPLPTASNMGVNFYIGNHAGASGLYQPLRGFGGNASQEADDATVLAQEALGRELAPAEVSRYWFDQGMRFLRESPVQWAGLLARKWMLVWNKAEVPDTEAIEAYASDSSILAVLVPFWHWGVLLPVAAMGAWLTRKRWSDLLVLYAILLALAASISLFFVFARFRHPMAAPLALLAAAGLTILPGLVRRRRYTELAVGAGFAVVVAVASNWPVLPAGFQPEAITRTNLGNALLEENRFEEAAAQHRRALTLRPGSPEAHYGLGLALAKQGDADSALDHFLAVLEQVPNHADTHYFVGLIRRRQGNLDAARRHFEAAIALRPDHVDARNNLAAIYVKEGRIDEARQQYESALATSPDHADTHYNLAGLFARQGNLDQVRYHLRELLRVRPDDAEARTMLARIESQTAP